MHCTDVVQRCQQQSFLRLLCARTCGMPTTAEILESRRTILDEHLKVSISAEGCFCGPLVSKLMEVGELACLRTLFVRMCSPFQRTSTEG